MSVSLGLLDYMPLPLQPFDKGLVDYSVKKVEETAKAIDQKVQKYKYTDAYAYHPHNIGKVYQQQKLVETVYFVVA